MNPTTTELPAETSRWQVPVPVLFNTWKHHAGATSLTRRSAIRLSKSDPPRIRTNIAVPSIPVGRQTLYLLPDHVLVFESGRVGAVGYSDLRLEPTTCQFIEEQEVPSDAEVVGQTWKYVNKKGGPDRRFKDNRQIPVVKYGELVLRSDTGLNELIHTSNQQAPQNFAQGVAALVSAMGAPTPREAAG